MGSFLNQCCISNQIIKNGYLIPIVVKKGYSKVELTSSNSSDLIFNERPLAQSVYAQDTFMPLGFMFEGEYSDCNHYTLDWTKNLEMLKCFIKFLQENSLITLEGENECHEKLFNPLKEYTLDTITVDNAQDLFDDLQEKINKGRVFISYFNRYALEIKFSVVEKIAGDEVEANGIEYLSKDRSLWFSSEDEKQDYLKRLISTPEETLIALTECFKKVEQNAKELKELFELVDQKDKLTKEDYRKICHLIEPVSFKYFLRDEHSSYIYNLLDYLSPNTSLNTIRLLRKLKGIVQGLNVINMGLKPTQYGSQDYCNETGQMFSKIMANVTIKYSEQHSCEEDEDENE